MAQAYYIAQENPPEPPGPAGVPYRAPEPGLPPSPPAGPVEEPPMAPPGTGQPPGTSIPSPITL
jgi:hypothetical protein